ncbi:MAG: D-aminoacyl-tRNA deacylase [Bacillaceae bacterium]
MKVVIQRAKNAKVIVNEETVGSIEKGLMLLVGITHEDTLEDVAYVADKVANLRIFEDENEKLNLSVKDIGGAILSVSQFTLYGDCKKGRRPSFSQAARPAIANELYEKFNEALRTNHQLHVETGVFGAMMDVQFTNDGPVTLIVESK